MNSFFVTCTFSILFVSISIAQVPITQIEGFLEVYHPEDESSIYIGQGSGQSANTSSPKANTFVGRRTGSLNTTGELNSFFGSAAGQKNTTGRANSFFGWQSGNFNTTASDNSFYGYLSGRFNTTGFENSFFGAGSGANNSTGFGNSFFGAESGSRTTIGVDNSFFGRSAAYSNTTGSANSFFGAQSGWSNTDGGNNSFFGQSSGYSNTTGVSNSFFGRFAGSSITSQSQIIALGANAGPISLGSGENKRLYIDVEQTNDPLIYGEFDNNLLRVNGTLQLGARNYIGTNNAGVIRSPGLFDADLYLVSTDDVYIEIGENAGQSGTFEIWNGPDLSSTTLFQTAIFKVDELGNVSSAGAINGSSDVNRKETFNPINSSDILLKIANLPISEWQYKGSTDRHIGPMAQDFYAAFGLGQGETTIATVDADGVALAAIQALAQKNEKMERKNKKLETRIERLERLLLNYDK